MSIFVIADLHLSFETNKPMNVFGENWEDHEKKIENNWRNKVNEKDLVILPGDFSWKKAITKRKPRLLVEYTYKNA